MASVLRVARLSLRLSGPGRGSASCLGCELALDTLSLGSSDQATARGICGVRCIPAQWCLRFGGGCLWYFKDRMHGSRSGSDVDPRDKLRRSRQRVRLSCAAS